MGAESGEPRAKGGKYWDKPWSLVDGCTPVSPGCENCWSKAMAERFHRWPEKVTPRWDRLDIPLKVKKPTVWAVWNDLFHEDVPFRFICDTIEVIKNCPHHIFLVLTKRPERALELFTALLAPPLDEFNKCKNLWLGVTAENQEMADKKIPILLQIPAAIRFVSIEPMLGPVSLDNIQPELGWFIDALSAAEDNIEDDREFQGAKIDWIICGGETGPKARPMHPDWVESLRDQCQAAGVPFWFKGWGEWIPTEPGYIGNQAPNYFRFDDGTWMFKAGRKNAGRLLDGREWDERPWIRQNL